MARRLFKLKYPKLLFLLMTFILAYFLFAGRNFRVLQDALQLLGYFGTFIAGLLFAYGFTAAPATAILLILAKEQNILIAGLIAGLGALTGDWIIFRLIRSTFSDEINSLSNGISNGKMMKAINHTIPSIIKKHLLMVIAGFIIASPLPDEIGVSLMATSRHISPKLFTILSYLLNTIGIFLVLYIGRLI